MHAAIAKLAATGHYTRSLTVSLILMTIGLSIKSALYPFGAWLPDAHGSATNASSAVLSGLVLKGHIFLILKVFCRVFGTNTVRLLRGDTILLGFGILGMVVGSMHALRQTNAKRMIAWSSVAQVGYIFMGIGLNTPAGFAAACLHSLVHATVKPMLFTAVGGLVDVSGHGKALHALRGAFYRNRWAGVGLITGACSMVGIPAFAGFASKLCLASAAIEASEAIPGLTALALSSLLNALYYIPAVIVILTPRDGTEDRQAGGRPPSSRSLSYGGTMAAFLALTFFLGLCYGPVMRVIEWGLEVLG